MNSLYSKSSNLQSGFRTFGIYPLCAQKVLDKLPDADIADDADAAVNAKVSGSVIELLGKMRGLDDAEKPKPKKRKVAVEPGVSVSLEDVYGPQPSTSSDQQMFNADASTDAESQGVNDNSESQSSEENIQQ